MARTITSVNVQLGFEYEKFKRGVDGSISSWKTFQKIARDSVPEIERYNKVIGIVDQAFETGTIGAKQYGLMIDQVNYSFKQGEYAVSRYSSMIEKLSSWQTAAGSSASRMVRQLDAWSAKQKELVSSEKELVALEKEIDAGIKKRAVRESAEAAKILANAQSHVNSVIASGMTKLERYEAAIREFKDAATVAKISADDFAKGIGAINRQFGVGGKSAMIEKLTEWHKSSGDSSGRMIRQLSSWVEKQKELVVTEEKLVAAEAELDAGIRKRARQEAANAAKSLADAQSYVNSVLASGMNNWDRYIAELNRFRDAAAKAGIGIKEFAAGEAAVRKKFGIQTPDEFFEDQQLQLASEAADRLEKAVRRVDAAVMSGTSNWDKYQKELQQFQQDAALAGTGAQDIATGEAGIRKKFGILTSTEFFANQRKQEDDARKDRIAQLQRESMTFEEVASARMQELDSLRAAGLDSETYWRQTRKLNDEIARQAGIVSGGGGGGGFGKSLTSAIAMLGLKYYAVSQAISVVSAGMRTALNFDRQTVAFASLTGSVGEAKDMMDGFLKLSEKAPLSITAMQGGARTMLSFGASAKEAGAAVEMIAKITGGDEMRFQNMSLAFSQIRAGGRLMGQELRQMIDAGFNPLEHISAQTGVSMMELRKIMEDGGLSFDMVRQAMEEATTGGGRFARLLDDIAETASGKLQNTIAQANRAVIDFASFMDLDIKNIVDGLSNLASILKVVLTPPLYVVVKAFSFFATGINSIVAAFNQLVIAGQNFVSWVDSFMPKGSGLSDVFKQIGKDLYAVYEFFGGGEFGEQLRQTESLLNAPASEGQKAADGVEKIGGAYKSLNDATKVASDATNEYYSELEQRFSAALKSSGKYTEAQLKIAEIESRGIKLNDVQKKGIIDRTAAVEKFEKQVRDAQEAEKKIEKQREEATKRQLEQAEKAKKAYEEQQEKLRDLMKELRPQDEAKRKVDEVIAQMNELDRMFGLKNLGISSKDINRVVASRAGATQGESLDYRLGEAVQAGSSAAIQKLYDFQVKQDTSDILTDISQTSRDQLDLLRQKLDNGVVLAGARS